MRAYLSGFFFIWSYLCLGQLNETFNRNNFKTAPEWIGDTNFFVINNNILQANGPATSASIYLSTQNNLIENTEWSFYTRFEFNPSSSNFIKVYLTADKENLNLSQNGYFLKLGGISGNQDAIEFHRQDGLRSIKIAEGIAGNVGKDINSIRIKVIRDQTGNWQIYSDKNGGTKFELEMSCFDNTYSQTSWFGISFTHTITRRDKAIFNDFIIKDSPLSIISAIANDAHTLALTFTHPPRVENINISNFGVNKEIGNPERIIKDTEDPTKIKLIFNKSFIKGTYTLEAYNLRDKNDILFPLLSTVFHFSPTYKYGDILITEIHPKPDPPILLPDEEFVELYNNTEDTIDLDKFVYADPTAKAVLPTYQLAPQSYVILCRSSMVSEFSNFGPSLGVAPWPVLNNSGDEISLRDKKGNLIFYVKYHQNWFEQNKRMGGWSLEMIDLKKHCLEEQNWTASIDPNGGTPGKTNSVNAHLNESIGMPSEIFDIENKSLKLKFSTRLDSSALTTDNFTINPYHNFSHKLIEPTIVELQFDQELQYRKEYLLQIKNLKTCTGASIQDEDITFAIPEKADSLDIIINEVLFNPRDEGVRFIEIYNNTSKFINLRDYEISTLRNSQIYSPKKIHTKDFILKPESYLVITTDRQILKEHYPSFLEENAIILTSLPVMSNTAGVIVLLDDNQKIIDQFSYNENMHFSLIHNKKGVSLERVSFYAPTNQVDNWHSAAELHGYATPGFKNSQAQAVSKNEYIHLEPKVITPDGDGYNDFLIISYNFPQSGQVANVYIYDIQGRIIKRVARNSLLAQEGFFRWDGTDDNLILAYPGYYIIYLEVYGNSGKVETFKETVVLGTKFR